MAQQTKTTIAVGICSYKNPLGLKKALFSLAAQEYDQDQYELRAFVVDNDTSGVNQDVVDDVRKHVDFTIDYDREPQQGLSFARNLMVRVVLRTNVDAFLFIDDDEYAASHWLQAMLNAWEKYEADIVGGPVLGVVPQAHESWLSHTTAFHKDRPNANTGDRIKVAYTDNTLVDIKVLKALGATFHPELNFTGGEDLHYFMRAMDHKFKMVWCREAVLFEDVTGNEASVSGIIKRYFHYGVTSAKVYYMVASSLQVFIVCLCLSLFQLTRSIANLLIGILFFNTERISRAIRFMGLSAGTFTGMLGLGGREHYKTYRSQI